MSKVLDSRGNPVSPAAINNVRRMAGLGKAFEAAGYYHKDLENWYAPRTSGQTALDHERDTLNDRIQDLARNDGWASAAMDRQVDQVIGAQWTLSVRLPHRLLNIDEEVADDLAEEIESEWNLFANNPEKYSDRPRERTVIANWALAYRQRISTGEAWGVLHYLERGGDYATTLEIIDGERVSNPHGRINSEFLREGISLDENGAAYAYHIAKHHPAEIGIGRGVNEWEEVQRETEWGRPIVLHAFDAERPGQKRGKPPLAPITRRLRQITRYDDVEMQAATLNAVMAAFITSPFDHELLADSQGLDIIKDYNKARREFHDKSKFSLPSAQTGFLYAGEEASLTKPEHPNAVYESYIRAALRNVASAAGITYEQLTQDWSNVNYSSARAALLEVYKIVVTRRERFKEQFVTPFYCAFLEEAFGKGRLRTPAGAPSFDSARHLYSKCVWIAPGRGWVDPLKEAQGANERLDGLLSTLQDEHAEQGKDTRDVIDQVAREQRLLERRKVSRGGEMKPRTVNQVEIAD